MNATAEPVTDGELEAKTPKVLGSRTLAKAAGEFSDFLEGLGADEVDEPDIDVENELETVEEHQVVIFFFPERNLLFSIGDLDTKGPLVEACRATLLNPKSAVLSDLLGDADGSDGCGTLMVVMLDSCIDQVFPIMDVYGDALEGLRILCQEGPKYHHIKVSNFLKSHVMHIRRYLWDARGLFMELSQDMCGAMGATSRVRVLNLLESTAQLEKEAEANIEQCHEVEVCESAHERAHARSLARTHVCKHARTRARAHTHTHTRTPKGAALGRAIVGSEEFGCFFISPASSLCPSLPPFFCPSLGHTGARSQVFFSAWQDTQMNNQLFWLTNFSVIMLPVQTVTGWYAIMC
jgi:hypothetical protein